MAVREIRLSTKPETAILGVPMKALTSPQNPLIKAIRRAVASDGLTHDGFCVTEGFHLLEEALRTGCEIGPILATDRSLRLAAQNPLFRSSHLDCVYEVPEKVFAQISSTETPQGILALVRPPSWTLQQILGGKSLAVVLDGIQEPGNAGAIVRAAEAFAATGAVFLKGAVHPFNPKCLRASAGSLFRLPMVYGVEEEAFWTVAGENGLAVYAAMPLGSTALGDADLTGPCAFILGSEGRGVRPEIAARASGLRIPTVGVESLNAAVAAGILLYEARRQRTRQP
jgi:RNA methyltransferase, TrmH family